MIEGIELFYQQIAEAMIESIPEEWSSATFEAFFYPKSSSYEGEYTRKADGVARDFPPASGGCRAFRQLRKKFKDAGKPLWGRASFVLQADGTFNMKWIYDDCDHEGNTLFNEERELWRREERRKRLTII